MMPDASNAESRVLDRSDAADAARLRWMLNGNGYFLEENSLCGQGPRGVAAEEMDEARRMIDDAMGVTTQPKEASE